MNWSTIAGICLLLPTHALRLSAQELPPEVLLLARIKTHLRAELANTPNYTCLETVSRFRGEAAAGPRSHRRLAATDTVRLEIVYSDHREWYGSPGDRNLNVSNPVSFVGSGMMGNGAFASTLNNILAGAAIAWRGEETLRGRPAVRFDFRLSRQFHAFTISIPGGSGTVGEEGSFWVDPRSLDLIRLESRAAEIPPYLPLDSASTTVDYARVRLGDSSALLAQEADSYMVETRRAESDNHLAFTHCHSYSTQSEIRFDTEPGNELTDDGATSGAPGTATVSPTIPAGLTVTVQLTTPVSGEDAVGALIEGTLADAVQRRGKTWIPAGSVVRGRIRRLEQSPEHSGGGFIVGLEFTEVELPGGGAVPFYADLLRLDSRGDTKGNPKGDKTPQFQQTRSEEVILAGREGAIGESETITLPELPGVASFFSRGKTLMVPRGFRTIWRARGPIR